MDKSNAFHDFMKQTMAKGYQKLQGYNKNLFDEIYQQEREEVESKIVEVFNNGDSEVAIFLPQLKKFNGIEMLKNRLKNSIIPSGASINYAITLFRYLKDNQYLDILKRNLLSKNKNDRLRVLSALCSCKPSNDIYNIFTEVCMEDENEVVRGLAATGILYCKGYISDPFEISISKEAGELEKKLSSDDANIRKVTLDNL